MYAVIKLYSDKIGEISSFLTHFYKNKTTLEIKGMFYHNSIVISLKAIY